MTKPITPYAYWRTHREPGNLTYYNGRTDLYWFLRNWLRLQWWRLGFWFAHKLERQPLPPVPERVLSGEVTTTTFDELVRGSLIKPIVDAQWWSDPPVPLLRDLPLKPKDET